MFHSPVISGTSANHISTATTTCDESYEYSSAWAIGTAAGITVGLSLVIAVLVGVLLGYSVALCLTKRKRSSNIDSHSGSKKDKQEVIYEEPVAVAAVETAFSLSDKKAYGKVKIQGCR